MIGGEISEIALPRESLRSGARFESALALQRWDIRPVLGEDVERL